MKCAIATLFEHHYHLGAAVLINSLSRAGFKGTLYAGLRGPLPPWSEGQVQQVAGDRWQMEVTSTLRVMFLALETTAHFTNFKPDFLLQVEALAADSEALVYCDPDLVINGPWGFFEDWLTCGAAVCEDINSPMGRNHPRRVGWQRFFAPFGYELRYRGREYANGGFLGLRREYRQLLLTWQDFQARISGALGGADVVGIGGGRKLAGVYGFADCFRNTDQDVLNAALEALPEIPVSFLGPQTMGFKPGFAMLPHALGPAKPWRRHYVREALGGRPPSEVDKAFWRNVSGPVHPFSEGRVSSTRWALQFGAATGRMVRRS